MSDSAKRSEPSPSRALRLRRAPSWRGARKSPDCWIVVIGGDTCWPFVQMQHGHLGDLQAVMPGPWMDVGFPHLSRMLEFIGS
jgi:hypothetical protein